MPRSSLDCSTTDPVSGSRPLEILARLGAAIGRVLSPLALIFACAVSEAWADDMTNGLSWLRLSGFGTLGLVHDNREGLRAQRDFGQPDTFTGHWSWKMDSILGLQLNAALTDQLDAAIQLVLKERAERTLAQSLEWAFLRWRLTPGLAVRSGRLGADFYLLSDYRDVGFAYLWERPPVEFYGPLLLHHFDGADLTYSLPLNRGSLRARLFGGEATQSVELTSGAGADTLELGSLWGASLTYESERWQLKSGFIRFRIDETPQTIEDLGLLASLTSPVVQDLWRQAGTYGAELGMAGRRIGFYSLGAAYDDNTWLLSGELGYLSSSWDPLRDTLTAYLSIGRRLGDLTPYLVLATASPLERETQVIAPAPAAREDPTIAALYAGTLGLYDSANLDQHTLSLGVRWDLRPNLALKLQWDHVEIERSALWWTGGALTHDTSAELLSASLSWIF